MILISKFIILIIAHRDIYCLYQRNIIQMIPEPNDHAANK